VTRIAGIWFDSNGTERKSCSLFSSSKGGESWRQKTFETIRKSEVTVVAGKLCESSDAESCGTISDENVEISRTKSHRAQETEPETKIPDGRNCSNTLRGQEAKNLKISRLLKGSYLAKADGRQKCQQRTTTSIKK
jgi:hypothetical protein